MKLTSATLALSTALLTSLLPLAAFAADLPDPAPTDVQISWASDGSARIHVTWNESEARPNKVMVRDLDQATASSGGFTTADAPNSVDIPVAGLRTREHLRVAVAVGTREGVTSPDGNSAIFDSKYPETTVDSVTFSATGMTVKSHSTLPTDTTPGDPLDDDETTYEPMYVINNKRYPLGPATPTTDVTVTHPAPNYRFFLASNSRWDALSWGDYVTVDHARLSATMPARWQYGSEMPVTGSIGPVLGNNQGAVILQARNSPTSAWYVVTSTSAAYETGNFAFSFLAKTREYRIAMANSVTNNGGWSVFYGGYSAVMKSQAYQRVYALFTTPTIKVGQTSNVHVQLNVFLPTGLVALQRWNGKTWVFVQNIALKDNVGWAKVTGKAPGNSTYRIYSPNVTKDGMLVAAAYSPNFVLSTVR